MYTLDGKVALVTGAGQGIGKAIAGRLAQEGAAVGVLDIDSDAARATVMAIEADGGSACPVLADVAKPDEVRDAVAEIESRLGPVAILVNNAGIWRGGALADMDFADWQALFRVNVDGAFHCAQAVVAGMRVRRYGRIVNIASWAGKAATPGLGAYGASKAALIAFTRSLGLELAADGITVNAICPGTIIETKMREQSDAAGAAIGRPTAAERVGQIPVGRLGLPADVARVAAFLASDEADYMTGQAINVTGGLWML